MFSLILPLEENACGYMEGSSITESNSLPDNLSVSMDTCEPFFVRDDDSCKALVASDTSGTDNYKNQSHTLSTDSLIGAFSTISIVESSGQIDEGVKVNIGTGDASDANCPEIICSSPRRSTRISKLNRKTEADEAAGTGRKTAKKKALLDLNILKITRRRRSFSCKRARSSAWGLLGSIAQTIEQNTEIDAGKNAHKRPRKRRSGGQGGGKLDKSQKYGKLKKSKGKNCASNGHIRLKVKLGKEVGQIDLDKYRGSRTEIPKSAKDVNNKSEEEVPRTLRLQSCNGKLEEVSDASVLGVHLANKDNIEKSTDNTADNHCGVHSLGLDERLEVIVDDVGLDPGTSPDSEVINLIPDVQVCERASEDLHDVLISPQSHVALGDLMGLRLREMSIKKGKKKDKVCQPSNCSMQGKLPCSEITDNQEPREKMEDGSYCSETSVSNATGNSSGNASSSKTFSKEPLSSLRMTDFGTFHETLNVENGTEVHPRPGTGIGLQSPESQIPGRSLPHMKGRKLSKSSRSRGGSKIRSETTDSKSRNRNACRKKGYRAKPADKCKVMEKGDNGHVDCKAEPCPETGNHKFDHLGESETGKKSSDGDLGSSDMLLSCVKEQYVSPRSDAWVRCDNCFKWRRIPAALADSIRETNCCWFCKDNMDKDFADCSIPQEMSNAEINEELGISDASCEEDGVGAHLNCNSLGRKHSKVVQQSSWMHIKSNLFLHRSRKTQTIDEVMVCHCKTSSDGRVGCGDGCLNRMLNIECVQGTCPCGELCSNQQFQKRKYAKLRWFRCGKKGYGLQLLEDVKKGKFLIEYVGEVLDMHAYAARQREYAFKGHKHFYFMTLNGSEVIDACAKGNLGRFINHSCDPNCRTEKWMVNGEVCIGLFALRDIKKGEEVTFDYNYVRVFGAAAKKCVCGSPQCRGYIGGDPLNTEVIVQGDSDEEYPEPVMICEDGQMDDYLDSIASAASLFDDTEVHTAENPPENIDVMNQPASSNGLPAVASETVESLLKDKNELDNSTIATGEITTENEDFVNRSTSDVTGKTMCAVQKELLVADKSMKDPFCCAKISDTSLMTMHDKTLPHIIETKKKSKSNAIEGRKVLSNSLPPMKTSRSSSSVKKVKPKNSSVHVSKNPEMDVKSCALPYKSKKIPEGSFNGRFEAVEEKLNELLDADGGISKRKDASRGYLKLLLLTAASGDNGNCEAIQSNRDLSMILDALLKTKSRTVLVDIINKNGLQMLHNIMKRYRKEYYKIPILRKLLKVLEYLAVREIIAYEHINGGPPCPGVESFRESILTLTEHIDKQVHQIARNFRDKWIPRHLRKNCRIDRDDGKMEFHRASSCNMFPQPGRPTEATDCLKQSIPATTVVDASIQKGSSLSCSPCVTNGTVARKRKSRWDQPAEANCNPESPWHKEPRIHPILLDGKQNFDSDTPPGFSPGNSCLVPSNASSNIIDHCQGHVNHVKWPCEVVLGHQQERFISRLSVSYGIPMSFVQQFGTFQPESVESWVVAPGMPFHPFPPLPQYPRDKKGPLCATNPMSTSQPAEQAERDWQNSAACSEQSTPSTSGASTTDIKNLCENNQNKAHRIGDSYSLGRKYFRQPKWNNSKSVPPWIRRRNGLGFMGNNARNGMCSISAGSGRNEFRGPYNSGEMSTGVEGSANTFSKHSQHQN